VVHASPDRLDVLMPSGLAEGGRVSVRAESGDGGTWWVNAATPFATGLHQVDNPLIDRDGTLYVTYSGTRGQEVPVSIFRVRPNGTRETYSSGIVNPTSMALDPEGRVYVSSRFEGTVYRLAADGSAESFATDLGVACGLAFSPDGTLYVGDRSGTIFAVDRSGHASAFATLPPSVAAFHLAFAPDGSLYVTGPTLSSYDSVYRIDSGGHVTTTVPRFGRPQGLTFDGGMLFVTEALAGSSGVYRMDPESGLEPTLVLAGPGLVGLAFGPDGTMIVCSNDTAYRLAPSESGDLVARAGA
jgi:sugar lactone lactonase YvrE